MIAYSTDASASERLMKIALLCEQTSIICFADTVADVSALFKSRMGMAIKLMDASFFETIATKKIMSVTWPKDETFLAFKQKSCLISTDDCEKGVEYAYSKKKSKFEYLWYTRSRLKKKYFSAAEKEKEEKQQPEQLAL